MKIAILADIHGNLVAFSSVLSRLEQSVTERILLAGDLVGYGPDPEGVIALMRDNAVVAIRGNHDSSVISKDFSWMNEFAVEAAQWSSEVLTPDGKEILSSLPAFMEVEMGRRRIGLYHGSPDDPDEYVFEDERMMEILGSTKMDIVICGHTHVPAVVRRGPRLFLNPGSVGQPRDGNPCASFAILDLDSMAVAVERVPYDVGEVQRRMRSVHLPAFLIDRLARGV